MKKSLLYCLLLGLGTATISAQSLTFSKIIGGSRLDDARSVVTSDDGKIVITGLTKSTADSLGTMYLTCLNAAGAIVWSRQFDRLQEDGGNGLLKMRDGGYLISGHTALSYGFECDGYLLRVDANGREIWRAFVGKNLDDVATSSLELEDGSLVSVGRIEDPDSHSFRVLFARLDASGKQLFLKQLGGMEACLAYRVCRAADGNLLISAYADSQPTRPLLIKCTPEGEQIWQIQFDDLPGGRVRQTVALPDGDAACLGEQLDADGHFDKMWLARVDSEGKIIRQNAFSEKIGVKNALFDALLSADGSLLACGLEISETGEERPFVGRFNQDLDLLESRVHDQPSARFRSISSSADGCMALAGQVQNGQSLDIFVARQVGFEQGAAVVESSDTPFLLFPNPFSGQAFLKIDDQSASKKLVLKSPDGRLLQVTNFAGTEIFINGTGLPKGLILFSVENEQGKLLKTGRLILAGED